VGDSSSGAGKVQDEPGTSCDTKVMPPEWGGHVKKTEVKLRIIYISKQVTVTI
jgi:hypothetical protein